MTTPEPPPWPPWAKTAATVGLIFSMTAMRRASAASMRLSRPSARLAAARVSSIAAPTALALGAVQVIHELCVGVHGQALGEGLVVDLDGVVVQVLVHADRFLAALLRFLHQLGRLQVGKEDDLVVAIVEPGDVLLREVDFGAADAGYAEAVGPKRELGGHDQVLIEVVELAERRRGVGSQG